MCIATRDIMDNMFEAYIEGNIIPDDIPITNDPVYILGKKYNALEELSEIRQDILSKLWLSYRKNFVPIGGDEGLTSDKGWGCMLRCGQMVLAQALINLHLGRDWLWHPDTKDSTYLKILKRFEDRRQAPFSIHQIAMMGISEKKSVGEWFGPNTIAQVLKKLVKYDDWCGIEIHVALDNALIISEVKDLCCKKEGEKIYWKPLLLIVPLRLGLNEINPVYIQSLKKCFQFKQSLGVIGGKPNLALYFIGYVGDEVIYLDPHTTQKAGCVENKETIEQIELDATYHCKYASRMNILSMDPSVAVCFYCDTEQDFNNLCQQIKDQLIKIEKQPIFEIAYEPLKQWFPLPTNKAVTHSFNMETTTSQESSDQEFEII